MSLSSAPVVAHVSPNGNVGRKFLPVFVEAVRNGDFAKLNVVTTSITDNARNTISSAPEGKIEVFEVSYEDKESICAALRGVDVLISTIGGYGSRKANDAAQVLIEAAAAVGVKVYFRSDYSFDYMASTREVALFDQKKIHKAACDKLGLHSITVCCGAFMELLRTPLCGVNENDWNISGDGDALFSTTAMDDVARYLVRAALLASGDPSSVPTRLRIYGDTKTWTDFADITEKLTGKPITRKYTSVTQIEQDVLAGKQVFFPVWVICGSKFADFTDDCDNELLNPAQRYFKPKSFEDFVRSTL